MRKTLCLAAALCLALLTGCSGAVSSAAAAAPSAPSAAEPEAGTAAPSTAVPGEPEAGAADSAPMRLDITVRRGSLYLRSGTELRLERNGQSLSYTLQDGTLLVEHTQDGDAVLTLPEGTAYEQLILTVDQGHVYGETPLALQELMLETKQGEVSLADVAVSSSTRLTVTQGSALFRGDPGPQVTVCCDEGKLALELTQPKEAYQYTLEVSEGDIRLGDAVYHGRDLTETLGQSTGRTMALTCRRGDLSLSFGASDAA